MDNYPGVWCCGVGGMMGSDWGMAVNGPFAFTVNSPIVPNTP